MSNNSYGGVAGRGPVKGAYGIGKIHLKFKPKVNKVYSIKGILAIFTYSLFILMIIFSYSWSQKDIKYKYLFPFVQNAYTSLDIMRSNIEYYIYLKTTLSHITSNINIDSNGIPTITSSNLSHALYLQGYQHAKDRIISMDILRRKSLGNLSTLYGNTTISIESDKLMRTLNIPNIAKLDAKLLDHDDLILLESYSNGINQYLQEKQSYSIEYYILYTCNLFSYFSSWFTNKNNDNTNTTTNTNCSSIDTWEPYHTLAILRMLSYEWSHNWEEELNKWLLLKTFDDMSLNDLWYSNHNRNNRNCSSNHNNNSSSNSNVNMNEQDGNSFLPSLSSIAIAISKHNHTSAYLANNINTKSISSKLWYFNNLHTTNIPSTVNDLQVSGVSVPGIPYVLIGRNHNISWGMTISTLYDTEDLFIIKDNSSSSNNTNNQTSKISSIVPNNNDNISIRTEYIYMKDKQDPYILNVTDTLYGPAISNLFIDAITSYILTKTTPATTIKTTVEEEEGKHGTNDILIALSSQSLKQPMNLKFLHQLNHATDFIEFQSAMNNLQCMHLNVLYSDINGNIGSVVTGRNPIRTITNSGDLPTEGIVSNVWMTDQSITDRYTTTTTEDIINIVNDNHTTTKESISITTTTSIISEKVTIYNPVEGFIIATDYPFKALTSSLLDDDANKDLVSFKQLQFLLLDTYSHTSLIIKQLLLNITSSSSIPNDNNNLPQEHYDILIDTKKIISNFDGYYHMNEAAPVLIEAFRSILVSNILSSLGGISTAINQNSPLLINNRLDKYPIRLEIDWIQNYLLNNLPNNDHTTNDNVTVPSNHWIQRIKRFRPHLRIDYSNFLLYTLIDAYQWCSIHYGSNSEEWAWAVTHHTYIKPTHTHLSPVVKAALSIGPLYDISSGGLDSLLRSEYSSASVDLKIDYDGHGLMASSDSISTSLRLAFDMGISAAAHCYYGNTPYLQSNSYHTYNNNYIGGGMSVKGLYKKLRSFWYMIIIITISMIIM